MRRSNINLSMVKLDVSSNDMRAGGASVCEAIGGMKRLAELDISSNELNEHGMAALGVAIGASASLATVDASGNHARKAGVAVGEGIARSASLTELNISDSKLGGEGAGMMEEVVEQVVEEGAIVLEQGQHVVMVTEGEMGGQQIVITDGGEPRLIQLQSGVGKCKTRMILNI